jgi:hypothetical protein
MCQTVKKGTTAKLLLLYARDAADRRTGKTGLRHDAPGASAAYVREEEPQARSITLTQGRLGVHQTGGFAEVDPDLMPGVYQFGVPDELLAGDADTAMLLLRFPGAVVDPVEINLVAYDPQDEERLGMTAIGREGRIAALRGAFPRLAKELEP